MRPAKAQVQLHIYSLHHLQIFTASRDDCHLLTSSITFFFTEISLYNASHNWDIWHGVHYLPLTTHKVITKTNCFILFTHAKWEWNIEKMRLSACNETIQPPEKLAQCFYWGPSLLVVKFVRGQIGQGPRCPGIHNHDCEWICLTALHGLGSA